MDDEETFQRSRTIATAAAVLRTEPVELFLDASAKLDLLEATPVRWLVDEDH